MMEDLTTKEDIGTKKYQSEFCFYRANLSFVLCLVAPLHTVSNFPIYYLGPMGGDSSSSTFRFSLRYIAIHG